MKTSMLTRAFSLLLAVLCLAAAALTLTACEKASPDPAGKVNVTLTVTKKDGGSKNYPVEATSGATLKDAMLQAGVLTEEGIDNGMILTVDGETADYAADGAYWALSENGEYLMTGAETTILRDGATYEITYTVYGG